MHAREPSKLQKKEFSEPRKQEQQLLGTCERGSQNKLGEHTKDSSKSELESLHGVLGAPKTVDLRT